MGLADITNTINDLSDKLTGVEKGLKLREVATYPCKGYVQKQNVPIFMEIENGKKMETFIFPNSVESIEYIWQTRSAVTYTQAGAFQDITGIIPPKILINGTFGYQNTAAADGMDGAGKQLELEHLIAGFFARFSKYTQYGKPSSDGFWANAKPPKPGLKKIEAADPERPPKFLFYDFVTMEYWYVNLDNFKFYRNKDRRMLYMYSISLTGLKRISPEEKKGRSKIPQGIQKKTATGFLAALGGIKSFIAGVQKFLIATNRFIGAIVSVVQSAINIVKQVTSIIKTAIAQVKTLINLPASLALQFRNAMTDLMDAIVSITDIPNDHVVSSRQAVRVAFQLQAATKNNTVQKTPDNDTSAETKLFGNSQSNQTVSVAKVGVTANDTIYSIAQKNGVDWKQMVTLNGLTAPYISNNFMDKFTPAASDASGGYLGTDANKGDIDITVYGITPQEGKVLVIGQQVSTVVASVSGNAVRLQDGLAGSYVSGTPVTMHDAQRNVLMPGEMIGIPGTGTGVSASATGDSFEETLYWIDEALDNDGNMIGHGDVAVRKGLSNLEMQLQHRLMTQRGELSELGHPEYGSRLPEFIGMTGTDIWHLRAKLECENTLREDPRVADVTNTRLVVDNSAIYFEGDVYPINQAAPTSVSLPLT